MIENADLRMNQLLEALGITADFRRRLKMPLQIEAADLIYCEQDMFDRAQMMTPVTAAAWHRMRAAAADAGQSLLLVSAYRSVDYQCTLIRNKLERGQSIAQILAVNAAPGYSEHHTGRALDLACPECEPLSEDFEATPAFAWLTRHASEFGFVMSYPRDNDLGIIYEPWHWVYQDA